MSQAAAQQRLIGRQSTEQLLYSAAILQRATGHRETEICLAILLKQQARIAAIEEVKLQDARQGYLERGLSDQSGAEAEHRAAPLLRRLPRRAAQIMLAIGQEQRIADYLFAVAQPDA